MRSRHLAVLPVAVALTFFAAGCGKKDTATTATPTATVAIPPSPEASSGASGDTSGSGSSGDTSSTGDTTSTGGIKIPPASPVKKAKAGETIPVVAGKDDDLTNFSTALGAANLTSLLSKGGDYTLFAPNNDAFTKIGTQLDTLLQPSSQAQLANILKFHIVKGRYSTKDLHNGQLLVTLDGARLRVKKKNGQFTIGNSSGKGVIVDSDIDATNGVIHVIDTVLTPPTG